MARGKLIVPGIYQRLSMAMRDRDSHCQCVSVLDKDQARILTTNCFLLEVA